jgi:UDP-glucose:(heptosyl)LPS alpha-1,3-glucosyltransferase
MNIAFCYESVLPARGGCETYITDLARRLCADGHEVHIYACAIDSTALPVEVHFHQLEVPRGPRFLRPWRFGSACERALRDAKHDVTIGFDKTWDQDVLYPQGGLHAASAQHNLNKHRRPWQRHVARALKALDPAHWSFSLLERKQYLGAQQPLVIVNSEMVRNHFYQHYGVPADQVRIVRSSINPDRFHEHDRPRRRADFRSQWGIRADEVVPAFIAMNYRLKGLEPLLRAVPLVPRDTAFRLLVAGHPKFTRYQRLAQRLGIADRVSFIGPQRDVQNVYFAADFLVHPTFYDPCSLVALEALACGLPVVTTRFNGASELLHPPRDGYVIDDPHDAKQLAWCLTQLCDSQRRSACAVAARRAAGHWTFEQHYREMLAVFQEAALRKRASLAG